MVDKGKASELEVQCGGSCFPAVRIVHLMPGALRHSSAIVWISYLPNPPSALYRSPGTWLGSEDCFKTLSYAFCHCAKTFEFCSKISWAFLKILNFLFLSLLLKGNTGASAEKRLELHDLQTISAIWKKDSQALLPWNSSQYVVLHLDVNDLFK